MQITYTLQGVWLSGWQCFSSSPPVWMSWAVLSGTLSHILRGSGAENLADFTFDGITQTSALCFTSNCDFVYFCILD